MKFFPLRKISAAIAALMIFFQSVPGLGLTFSGLGGRALLNFPGSPLMVRDSGRVRITFSAMESADAAHGAGVALKALEEAEKLFALKFRGKIDIQLLGRDNPNRWTPLARDRENLIFPSDYGPFMERHIPFPEQEIRRLVFRRVLEQAISSSRPMWNSSISLALVPMWIMEGFSLLFSLQDPWSLHKRDLEVARCAAQGTLMQASELALSGRYGGWGQGTAGLQASSLAQYFMDRYGAQGFRKFMRELSRTPYSAEKSFRRALGQELGEFTATWRERTLGQTSLEETAVAPGVKPLTDRFDQDTFCPRLLSGNRLFFTAAGVQTPWVCRLMEKAGEVKTLCAATGRIFAPLGDKAILYTRPGEARAGDMIEDLCLLDLGTGRNSVLTRGENLMMPTADSQGRIIAVVGRLPFRSQIFLVRDFSAGSWRGRKFEKVHETARGSYITGMAVEPSGDRIAFTVSGGSEEGLWMADLRDRNRVVAVNNDQVSEAMPHWIGKGLGYFVMIDGKQTARELISTPRGREIKPLGQAGLPELERHHSIYGSTATLLTSRGYRIYSIDSGERP